MIIKTLVVGELQTNCYFVIDEKSKNCFVIDPGAEGKKIVDELQRASINPTGIIITHAHPDHISAISYLKKIYHIPVYIHSLDRDMLRFISIPADVVIEENDILSFSDKFLELQIIHTPGHTPGSICLVGKTIPEFVLTGDTLFCGSVGRCDLPGGDEKKLLESLKKLIKLPGGCLIYPGHGPKCSISGEREHNPFVMQLI